MLARDPLYWAGHSETCESQQLGCTCCAPVVPVPKADGRLPNLSTTLNPLNELLHKDIKWRWSAAAEKAFKKDEELLTSASVLGHYDPKLPLPLAADASAYGIGAVISHVCEDGTERPIAFASRTLTGPENNYAQLEKRHFPWCLACTNSISISMEGHSFYTPIIKL